MSASLDPATIDLINNTANNNQSIQRKKHHSMYSKMPLNMQDMDILKPEVVATTNAATPSSSSPSTNPITKASSTSPLANTTSSIITADSSKLVDSDSKGGDLSKDNIINLGVNTHDINDRLRQLFNDDEEFGSTSFSQSSPIPKAMNSNNNDNDNISSNRLNSPGIKSIKTSSDTPSSTTNDAKKNLSAFLMQRRGSA